jgi:hypothetical protein
MPLKCQSTQRLHMALYSRRKLDTVLYEVVKSGIPSALNGVRLCL